ncbi:zinc finger protein 724-like [Teleopsis dalmanni]|uniref:zinc finger protein 724-like n=1 Tax=Teleopsis dalmanni TaxID=139649 RepID=UPI0018CDB088|nr:zinc finger protein 724-like [Teleopsis dalmanni]
MNSFGNLLYKCTLCSFVENDFDNIESYHEHLLFEHNNYKWRTTASSSSSKEMNRLDHLLSKEIQRMEKINFEKHSTEFINELDKTLDEMEELNIRESINSSTNTTSEIKNIDYNCAETEKDENIDDNENKSVDSITIYQSTYPIDKAGSYQNMLDIKFINNQKTICKQELNKTSDKLKKKKKRTPGYCDICDRAFNDLYNLRIHKMIHTGEMPFQCEECGKRFRQFNKLKIHRITHTNKKPFVCEICNKAFRFRNYLAVHKRLHTGDKLYKCQNCELQFHSMHSRRLHMKMEHMDTKKYTCTICEKVLTSQCYLTAHMKRHNNQRDFKCDHCDKCFFNQSQLKDHKLSHTDLKPYECDKCHMKFQRKSNYNQHLKIHLNVKTYICHLCNKAFAQSAGLYGHMKSHLKD